MKLFNNIAALCLSLVIVSTLTACASNPNSETWKLPKKERPDSAMIIGRIDLPRNKSENPNGNTLPLRAVNFMMKDKGYYWDGSGEKNFIMDNNYFVVTNIKPGKYFFRAFATPTSMNSVSESSSPDEKDMFEVKPGEIKFIGSFDYVENSRSFMDKVKNTGSYQLRKATHPTEQEMLKWLMRISAGSGWESSIQQKLR